MENKERKFTRDKAPESLATYLLAADNPVGKRQWRLIFRRKRARRVLTREQVKAIKKGRKVLRAEMKARGMKRLNDFEETAINLGLYFDRQGLLWPLLLWFDKGHTALKILATTTVLTTMVAVAQPVIEYITEYITEFITEYLTEYVTEYVTETVIEYVDNPIKEFLDKDRFTIMISDELMKTGFELSEKPFDAPDFNAAEDSKQTLFAIPVTKIPCISISQIPHNVDMVKNNTMTHYLTYTFYSRYINKNAEQNPGDLTQYAVNFDWAIRIHTEGLDITNNSETIVPDENSPKVSDAIWVMVIKDDEVIVSAKKMGVDENGKIIPEMLPSEEIYEQQKIGYQDWSIDHINEILSGVHENLTVDNLHDLEAMFGDQADEYQREIDLRFDAAGVQNLTRLMLQRENWREWYKELATNEEMERSIYRVIAEPFGEDGITVMERKCEGVLPWIEGRNEVAQKYTVVIWLEGDDPQCTNELMNGFIGMNFQIKAEGEEYMEYIITESTPETPETEVNGI